MNKERQKIPNEKDQEEIYLNLTRLIARTDVASNSYKLSTVAMHCNEKLLEEFLNDTPVIKQTSLKEFLQGQLYTAAFWGFHDVITVLLEYGADLNHKNQGTLWTPLHAACFQEHDKVVDLLIEKGANVRAKDKQGRTCVDIASASSKIWKRFERMKCERTSENALIRKGLIRRNSTDSTTATPRSTRLGQSSSSQMRAALGGPTDEDDAISLRTLSTSLNGLNTR
ncbi:unnamed protein product [Clavelina lepadiformis]|uniref:Uncharacterized protein n=1 Tax=Clavelina lepadiformis TaxID=159417 RepID=A0ABP0GWB4_CLALP